MKDPDKPRSPHDEQALSVGNLPVVAILGRPNVGKSTLFNRLLGKRAAIVEDRPGVTRDRIYANADIEDKQYLLMDMGGFETDPKGVIAQGTRKQCLAGIDQSDIILFVVDGRVSPTKGDFESVELLRKSGIKNILVVNKIDSRNHETGAMELHMLGLEPLIAVSALHGRGISELEDALYAFLPETQDDETDMSGDDGNEICKVAILGRPNAGKSSLVNCLLGDDRMLTTSEPGTTRDPVDSIINHEGKEYIIVDTAGIRRKRSVKKYGPEKMAVSAAVRSIARCHVCVLMIDVDEGIAEQDAKLLGLVAERKRACVVGLNKWDIIKHDNSKKLETIRKFEDTFTFAKWLKWVNISALNSSGIKKLMEQIDNSYTEFNKRISTSKVNRLFDDIINHHPPPLSAGKPVKLYYATQASTCPPLFVVHTNKPKAIHFSYRRYVENRIRKTFGFDGTPVTVIFRQKK